METCSFCGRESPRDARFCASCGTPLRSARGAEERKQITVVFADLVGSTAHAERADVEEVRDALDAFHALVTDALSHLGATVEKFIGDAVVAVFGAPTAHEDDPERAVRAALGIRDAVLARNAQGGAPELHVRVGVHTGEALVALAADPSSGQRIASGDVMNTAARLQTSAPVDSILVGERTFQATRDTIEYAPATATRVKGKAEPVPARLALRARARIGVDVHRPAASRLVDREEEWREVLTAFGRAEAGGGVQAVTLLGAPGIGKSRLAWELALHLERLPGVVRWRSARTPAYGERMTFFALAEMVKAEAGILDSDPTDAAARKLQGAVQTLLTGPEAAWVERHLRGLVGLEAQAELRGDRRAEAFAAWRRFLEAIAVRYPLVLAFEDLHWADDALLDFIEQLRAWSTSRILVLATARGELLDRRPGFGRGPNSVLIRVGPLAEGDTEALLSGLDRGSALEPPARRLLVANAGGNPLYAQEFLRMLVDGGPRSADSIPIPESVSAIIAARIDALGAEDKGVLQDAAVVGRVFWPGAVAAVADRGVWAVSDALRRIEDRELVQRDRDSSVEGEVEYSFAHALVRDVAYASIVRAQRGVKHRRAADWIEQLGPDRRERAGALAHHYDSALALTPGPPDAELRTRARRAFGEAADHELRVHAHRQAADLAERALQLTVPDDPERPRLLLTKALAVALADRPAEAQPALAEATAALADAGDPEGAAEAESTAAWLLAMSGDMEGARRHDARALAFVADRPPSAAKALVLCHAGTHWVFVRERHTAAAGLLAEALDLARALQLPETEAEALQFAGVGRVMDGDLGGIEDVARALALAQSQGSAVSLSCYGNLAGLRMRQGDLREASELHASGLAAALGFGMPVQVRRFRAEQAAHLYWRGEWDDALSLADEYLSAVEAGSPHQMEGDMRILRGRIRLARGDRMGAEADAERALEFGRHTGHPFDVLATLAFAARAALTRDGGRAEGLADELLTRLAAEHSLWAAWALPDAVAVATTLGRAGELAGILANVAEPTAWDKAALAHARGDTAAAAAVYHAMGALPEEAETGGGQSFWRSVGAQA